MRQHRLSNPLPTHAHADHARALVQHHRGYSFVCVLQPRRGSTAQLAGKGQDRAVTALCDYYSCRYTLKPFGIGVS